jgi:alpha/beta hydrolase fold
MVWRHRFLDTPIRIFLITVAGLHETDGRCHNQLAPARLLVAGRERALAQQIQLVLVEAALEPEQQAVVAWRPGPAGAGLPQTWYAWRRVMPLLAKRFTVVAVDPPGLGDSDKPENGYDTGSVALRLKELTAALGWDRFHFVGHDIGC